MLERIAVGTDITGVLPTMGIWPVDFNRALKSPVPLEEITFDFTKQNLEKMKDKVRNWPYYKETWAKVQEEIDEYKDGNGDKQKIEIISDDQVMAMKRGVITPRFGVLQGEKVRPIDDYRTLNSSVWVRDKVRL